MNISVFSPNHYNSALTDTTATTTTRSSPLRNDGSCWPKRVFPSVQWLSAVPSSNACPRNKKIGKDPRNTFWSNDTSRFGHQYLANLGWTPGQNLGDTTSSYYTSGHITEASSTGIKIQIKDDNLGIGAKKGAQHDECTGLLGLQGLLGRLNGNEQQVEQVRKEEERRKNELVVSKWGLRFVRGEVWVADDLTELRERILRDREAAAAAKSMQGKAGAEIVKEGEEKKEEEKHSKRKKRKRDLDAARDAKDRGNRSSLATTSGDETELQARKRRKEKRRIKRELKEARREERSERKEKKVQRKKEAKGKAPSDSDGASDFESGSASAATTRSATPTTRATNGRHAIRAKFIAAKRSAVIDAASLNEVG